MCRWPEPSHNQTSSFFGRPAPSAIELREPAETCSVDLPKDGVIKAAAIGDNLRLMRISGAPNLPES